MPGTFSVPDRMPRSCPPPSICAVSCTRGLLRRTYSAPTPFGPYILCALIDIRSMLSLITFTGTLPTACVASVWNSTPRSFAILPISAIGCITPISLLAYMMLIRIVLSVIAACSCSRSTRPLVCTGRYVTRTPCFFQALAGVENRLVLGGRRDDVVALFGVHLGHALQRQVVRFGRAAGEHDLLGGCADQARDLLARLLDRFFRFPAEAVIAAGGVAERLREIRHHRLEHARIHRRGRVIVHVDRQFHFLSLTSVSASAGSKDRTDAAADFPGSSCPSVFGESADISEMLMLAKSRRIPS